jgi:hypothetical protein
MTPTYGTLSAFHDARQSSALKRQVDRSNSQPLPGLCKATFKLL